MCYYNFMDMTTGIPEIESEIEKLKLLVAEQAATIAKLEALNAHYLEQLRLANRRKFGVSSERIDSDEYRQLTIDSILNEAEIEADATLPEPEVEEITYRRKKQTGRREKDLSGLPVERIEHELPEDQRNCEECGKPIEDIGVTIWRELEIIPAQVIIKEHAVHAYKDCDCHQKKSRPESHDDEQPDKPGNQGEPPAVERKSDQSGIWVAAAVAKDEDVPEIKTHIIRAESPKPLISGSLASPSAVAYIVN